MVAPGDSCAAGKEDVASSVLVELLCITNSGGAGHGLFHSRDMFPLKNTLIIAVVAPSDGGAAGKEDVASPVLMELLCGTARHGLFLLQYVLQRVLHLILVEQANRAALSRLRSQNLQLNVQIVHKYQCLESKSTGSVFFGHSRSGWFYHQVKIVRKTLISSVL